jgi:tRNA pseudouridine55 synthase
VDKPAGPTSHDVVARVRRLLHTRAAGHTGTLDPFATGLLVVLSGRATRLARFVEQQPKTYLATARLGVATTTDDWTGEVVGDSAGGRGPPSDREVETALASFVGAQRQRPPVFSAKHVGGERSYAKARRGEAVELAEVEIVVHRLELVEYAWPTLRFRTTVSAGTYVRTMAKDIAERLGTAGHLTALRREAIGELRVEQAMPLDALTDATPLLPPLAVLGHLPRVAVLDAEARAIGFGRAVPMPDAVGSFEPGGMMAITCAGRLIAVARERDGTLYPEVVLEPAG